MGELHQLLAVEPDLKATAQAELARVRGLFNAPDQFIGQTRTYRPLEEDGEPLPPENKQLAAHVNDEIAILFSKYGEWVDATMEKEVTNTHTSAPIIVNGVTLVSGLPAPALLNLEGKFSELKSVLQAIPTNDVTEHWEWDDGLGCYVSEDRITYRTKKVPMTRVAYEATKEHPAQVQAYTDDVREGEWTTVIYSGMITATEKRMLLDRVDEVLRAVKKARQTANNAEVVETTVANKLFDYITKG